MKQNDQPAKHRIRLKPRRYEVAQRRLGLRPLERLFRETVESFPSPPRPYPTWHVVRAFVREQLVDAVVAVVIYSVMLAALGWGALALLGASTGAYRIIISLVIAYAIVLGKEFVVPLFRWRRAVRYGSPTTATVGAVTVASHGANEVATGSWRVAEFDTDDPQAFTLSTAQSGNWVESPAVVALGVVSMPFTIGV